MSASHRWIQIYRDTVEELYAFVWSRCGGQQELCEDLVHECYMRALDYWSESETPDQPAAWLKTVARNMLHSYYRRRKPQRLETQDLENLLATPKKPSPRISESLQWALSLLEQKQALLLEGFHLEGLSIQALATRHGLSERAVEGRLRRARLHLRRLLEKHGFALEDSV